MYIARWGNSKWHKVARTGDFVCGEKPPMDRDTLKMNVINIYEIRGFPRTACEGCFRNENMEIIRRVTNLDN